MKAVTSIGDSAISYCTSLVSVTIGDSVQSIGKWAFDHCSSLASVTIPSSVQSIGDSAFYGCTKLAEVINRSQLPITKGSRDFGYVAYYADVVRTGE